MKSSLKCNWFPLNCNWYGPLGSSWKAPLASQGYILGDQIGHHLSWMAKLVSASSSGCVLQKLSRDDRMILSLIYRYFCWHPSQLCLTWSSETIHNTLPTWSGGPKLGVPNFAKHSPCFLCSSFGDPPFSDTPTLRQTPGSFKGASLRSQS